MTGESWLGNMPQTCSHCRKPLSTRGRFHTPGNTTGSSNLFMVRFLLIAGLLFLLVLVLNRSFGGLSLSEDFGHFLYEGLLILFVSSVLASGKVIEKFKYLGIWFAIIIVLVGIYSYRTELGHIKDRVMTELIPSRGIQTSRETMSFPMAANGHFYIQAQVNGIPVLFLADTGASHIVLTPSDARKLGLDPKALSYDRFYSTANGTVRGSSIRIESLSVGDIRFENIRASVNEAPMGESLLGMTFFKRLERYEVKDDVLTIYARP